MTSTSRDRDDFFAAMGLRPIINAASHASRLGGTRLAQPVVDAMVAASQTFVPIAEMQARASDLISEFMGAEAGCVASGADACLTLAAAACMTGDSRAAMDQLPDTTGLKNEIVMHRAHRMSFDHALRLAGARLVEIGYLTSSSGAGAYRWQMEAAITERTAACFYVGMTLDSTLDFKAFVEIAHSRGVPVIVDAAPTQVPAENFRRWIDLGADLVACAGGKYIGGPAASGFLAGRRDLVRAAALQQQDAFVHPEVYAEPFGAGEGQAEPPHQGIGRVLKVGREELAGLMAALKLCAARDYAAEQAGRVALSERLARAIRERNFEAVKVKSDDPVNAITVVFDTPQRAARVVRELQEGSPRVFVLNARIGQGEIVVLPHCVLPEEVEPLERRLLEAIALAAGEA
ncbi:MAG: aminotransferase class V-fold PLP-dependent enzyme [Proteobacteria bacterium]|nr:aminotransferase class V-fold PLP-dependent enzyme [Pseudomonadota bacterium]